MLKSIFMLKMDIIKSLVYLHSIFFARAFSTFKVHRERKSPHLFLLNSILNKFCVKRVGK